MDFVLFRILPSYLLAPICWMGIIFAQHRHEVWRREDISLALILYILTISVMFLPVFVSTGIANLLRPRWLRRPFAAMTFGAIYPFVQMAVFLSAADGMSSPRPDDPPFKERLFDLIARSDEAQTAFWIAIAFAIFILFPASRWRTQVG